MNALGGSMLSARDTGASHRFLVIVAVMLSGCAVHRPAQTYRLVQQENGAVLIPPGVAALV